MKLKLRMAFFIVYKRLFKIIYIHIQIYEYIDTYISFIFRKSGIVRCK